MSFLHSEIINAFNDTLPFLDNYAPGYNQLVIEERDSDIFNGKDDIHFAAQFKRWMQVHARKVQNTLEKLDNEIIGNKREIVVVDIGCGGGAGSIAIVDKILHAPIELPYYVYLIGIDPNEHALVIYNQMVQNLAKRILGRGIHIRHNLVAKGMPEALPYISEYLSKLRLDSHKPRLPNIIITQANVVHPLNKLHNDYANNTLNWLINHGVSSHTVGNITFGEIEAQSYEQLLQLSKADRAMLLTIGTYSEKKKYDQQDNVKQMSVALLNTITSKGHEVKILQNPDAKSAIKYSVNGKDNYYYSSALAVTHANYITDANWQEIVSLDNLQLAWARVHASQLRESLIDEFEIRIFEASLEYNLHEIRNLLINYSLVDANIHTLNDRYPYFYYQFPKKETEARPRTILRVEEEIIAAATIQILGQRASALMTNVFAYRLNNQRTEYFYKPWFRGYRHFIRAVHNYASKVQGNVVIIQVDIKNFYPSINQTILYKLAGDELRTSHSDRIMWLLQNLLIRKMMKGTIGDDLGIPQGGIISGFLANLYLTKIHEKFSDTYEKARLFRYVDDMILVIHDAEDEASVIADLDNICKELGVEIPTSLSEEKFFRWQNIDQFAKDVELSQALNSISQRFENKMSHLYLMNAEYRQLCQEEGNWWKFVNLFRSYLDSIGIYIKPDRLSRKLHQYIQNPQVRVKVGKEWRYEAPLNLLQITTENVPPHPDEWKIYFQNNNSNWIQQIQKIKEEISQLLQQKWQEYRDSFWEVDNEDEKNQILQKRALASIRFCLGRLARLGYDLVNEPVLDIFCQNPQIIREPRLIFEHIALQGNLELLLNIFHCFQNTLLPGAEYLRSAILAAFVYYPNANKNPEIRRILFDYAISSASSDTERLMALQSISALGICDIRLANDLVELLESTTEARLIAAIVLTVGDKYSMLLEAKSHIKTKDQYIKLAYSCVKKQQIENLWNPTEADLLRLLFYAKAYPDSSDEFEDGTSP